MSKKDANIQNKIRGSLLGGAAGDALGYKVEFRDEDEIYNHYGPSGITEYALDKKTGKAIISDDTQMTLFTANGLLIRDTRGSLRGIAGGPAGYIHKAYLDWLETQGYKKSEHHVTWLIDVPELHHDRAPGLTVLDSLLSGKTGTIHEPINNSKGCGGIMRIAPLALYNGSWDVKTADREAAKAAAITHGHPLGYMTAAVAAHIIYRGVYGGCDSVADAVCEAMDTVKTLFPDDAYMAELQSIVDLAVKLSANERSDLENINTIGEGWVAEETLAIAVYCALRYPNDFSKALIASVNHKGDSDSTGAVTGNILGAWLGYDAIEDRWKENLEIADVILEMADDLYTCCPMNAYDDYVDAKWLGKYVR